MANENRGLTFLDRSISSLSIKRKCCRLNVNAIFLADTCSRDCRHLPIFKFPHFPQALSFSFPLPPFLLHAQPILSPA